MPVLDQLPILGTDEWAKGMVNQVRDLQSQHLCHLPTGIAQLAILNDDNSIIRLFDNVAVLGLALLKRSLCHLTLDQLLCQTTSPMAQIAYQQPCASRYTPEKNVFLDEILELIGVERPPRKYERETALCCTAPIIATRLDMAVEFQEKNIRDAIECGADALVTLCPVCDRVMRRPTGQLGLTKIFITDLCRIALGEKPWPAEES